jgi:hypothetical protein
MATLAPAPATPRTPRTPRASPASPRDVKYWDARRKENRAAARGAQPAVDITAITPLTDLIQTDEEKS